MVSLWLVTWDEPDPPLSPPLLPQSVCVFCSFRVHHFIPFCLFLFTCACAFLGRLLPQLLTSFVYVSNIQEIEGRGGGGGRGRDLVSLLLLTEGRNGSKGVGGQQKQSRPRRKRCLKWVCRCLVLGLSSWWEILSRKGGGWGILLRISLMCRMSVWKLEREQGPPPPPPSIRTLIVYQVGDWFLCLEPIGKGQKERECDKARRDRMFA